MGKTTLAFQVASRRHKYLNWDDLADRQIILRQDFPKSKFVIFDEIHKFHQWRSYVKGFFDKHKMRTKIVVTGSARLDYYRHSGDSLLGRYHYYRLHPLSVNELKLKTDIDRLLDLGGFPEPFLNNSKQLARRWRRERRHRIIYEDIQSLEQSQELSRMESLLERLPELVTAPLSINSLREEMLVSHATVAKYLDIFERMYFIYRLPPYGTNNLRAIKKAQKHYHYDWAEVPDRGARFENLVAGHLLKWVHFQQDFEGLDVGLHYFRDTDGREVDFVITKNKQPWQAIECKLKARAVSSSLRFFKNKFPKTHCVQLSLENRASSLTRDGIEHVGWHDFLHRWI